MCNEYIRNIESTIVVIVIMIKITCVYMYVCTIMAFCCHVFTHIGSYMMHINDLNAIYMYLQWYVGIIY